MRRPPARLAERLVGAGEEVLRPDRDLRVEDVATMIGAARATLYYYFSGRDDIVTFLLEEHLSLASERMAAAVSSDEPPPARLRGTVTALIAFLGERPGVCSGLLSFAGASRKVGPLLEAKDAKLAAPLRDILDEGASAGQFVIGDSRDAASAILGAAMITTLSRWQHGGDTTSPDFQRALTDQILRGVTPG